MMSRVGDEELMQAAAQDAALFVLERRKITPNLRPDFHTAESLRWLSCESLNVYYSPSAVCLEDGTSRINYGRRCGEGNKTVRRLAHTVTAVSHCRGGEPDRSSSLPGSCPRFRTRSTDRSSTNRFKTASENSRMLFRSDISKGVADVASRDTKIRSDSAGRHTYRRISSDGHLRGLREFLPSNRDHEDVVHDESCTMLDLLAQQDDTKMQPSTAPQNQQQRPGVAKALSPINQKPGRKNNEPEVEVLDFPDVAGGGWVCEEPEGNQNGADIDVVEQHKHGNLQHQSIHGQEKRQEQRLVLQRQGTCPTVQLEQEAYWQQRSQGEQPGQRLNQQQYQDCNRRECEQPQNILLDNMEKLHEKRSRCREEQFSENTQELQASYERNVDRRSTCSTDWSVLSLSSWAYSSFARFSSCSFCSKGGFAGVGAVESKPSVKESSNSGSWNQSVRQTDRTGVSDRDLSQIPHEDGAGSCSAHVSASCTEEARVQPGNPGAIDTDAASAPQAAAEQLRAATLASLPAMPALKAAPVAANLEAAAAAPSVGAAAVEGATLLKKTPALERRAAQEGPVAMDVKTVLEVPVPPEAARPEAAAASLVTSKAPQTTAVASEKGALKDPHTPAEATKDASKIWPDTLATSTEESERVAIIDGTAVPDLEKGLGISVHAPPISNIECVKVVTEAEEYLHAAGDAMMATNRRVNPPELADSIRTTQSMLPAVEIAAEADSKASEDDIAACKATPETTALPASSAVLQGNVTTTSGPAPIQSEPGSQETRDEAASDWIGHPHFVVSLPLPSAVSCESFHQGNMHHSNSSSLQDNRSSEKLESSGGSLELPSPVAPVAGHDASCFTDDIVAARLEEAESADLFNVDSSILLLELQLMQQEIIQEQEEQLLQQQGQQQQSGQESQQPEQQQQQDQQQQEQQQQERQQQEQQQQEQQQQEQQQQAQQQQQHGKEQQQAEQQQQQQHGKEQQQAAQQQHQPQQSDHEQQRSRQQGLQQRQDQLEAMEMKPPFPIESAPEPPQHVQRRLHPRRLSKTARGAVDRPNRSRGVAHRASCASASKDTSSADAAMHRKAAPLGAAGGRVTTAPGEARKQGRRQSVPRLVACQIIYPHEQVVEREQQQHHQQRQQATAESETQAQGEPVTQQEEQQSISGLEEQPQEQTIPHQEVKDQHSDIQGRTDLQADENYDEVKKSHEKPCPDNTKQENSTDDEERRIVAGVSAAVLCLVRCFSFPADQGERHCCCTRRKQSEGRILKDSSTSDSVTGSSTTSLAPQSTISISKTARTEKKTTAAEAEKAGDTHTSAVEMGVKADVSVPAVRLEKNKATSEQQQDELPKESSGNTGTATEDNDDLCFFCSCFASKHSMKVYNALFTAGEERDRSRNGSSAATVPGRQDNIRRDRERPCCCWLMSRQEEDASGDPQNHQELYCRQGQDMSQLSPYMQLMRQLRSRPLSWQQQQQLQQHQHCEEMRHQLRSTEYCLQLDEQQQYFQQHQLLQQHKPQQQQPQEHEAQTQGVQQRHLEQHQQQWLVQQGGRAHWEQQQHRCAVEDEPVTVFHSVLEPSISLGAYNERLARFANCSPSCFLLALIYICRMLVSPLAAAATSCSTTGSGDSRMCSGGFARPNGNDTGSSTGSSSTQDSRVPAAGSHVTGQQQPLQHQHQQRSQEQQRGAPPPEQQGLQNPQQQQRLQHQHEEGDVGAVEQHKQGVLTHSQTQTCLQLCRSSEGSPIGEQTLKARRGHTGITQHNKQVQGPGQAVGALHRERGGLQQQLHDTPINPQQHTGKNKAGQAQKVNLDCWHHEQQHLQLQLRQGQSGWGERRRRRRRLRRKRRSETATATFVRSSSSGTNGCKDDTALHCVKKFEEEAGDAAVNFIVQVKSSSKRTEAAATVHSTEGTVTIVEEDAAATVVSTAAVATVFSPVLCPTRTAGAAAAAGPMGTNLMMSRAALRGAPAGSVGAIQCTRAALSAAYTSAAETGAIINAAALMTGGVCSGPDRSGLALSQENERCLSSVGGGYYCSTRDDIYEYTSIYNDGRCGYLPIHARSSSSNNADSSVCGSGRCSISSLLSGCQSRISYVAINTTNSSSTGFIRGVSTNSWTATSPQQRNSRNRRKRRNRIRAQQQQLLQEKGVQQVHFPADSECGQLQVQRSWMLNEGDSLQHQEQESKQQQTKQQQQQQEVKQRFQVPQQQSGDMQQENQQMLLVEHHEKQEDTEPTKKSKTEANAVLQQISYEREGNTAVEVGSEISGMLQELWQQAQIEATRAHQQEGESRQEQAYREKQQDAEQRKQQQEGMERNAEEVLYVPEEEPVQRVHQEETGESAREEAVCAPEEESMQGVDFAKVFFRVTAFNVHRLLLTAVTVAAKFTDDTYFANSYYARIGGIARLEMNRLEAILLQVLDYRLFVDPEDYERCKKAVLLLGSKTQDGKGTTQTPREVFEGEPIPATCIGRVLDTPSPSMSAVSAATEQHLSSEEAAAILVGLKEAISAGSSCSVDIPGLTALSQAQPEEQFVAASQLQQHLPHRESHGFCHLTAQENPTGHFPAVREHDRSCPSVDSFSGVKDGCVAWTPRIDAATDVAAQQQLWQAETIVAAMQGDSWVSTSAETKISPLVRRVTEQPITEQEAAIDLLGRLVGAADTDIDVTIKSCIALWVKSRSPDEVANVLFEAWRYKNYQENRICLSCRENEKRLVRREEEQKKSHNKTAPITAEQLLECFYANEKPQQLTSPHTRAAAQLAAAVAAATSGSSVHRWNTGYRKVDVGVTSICNDMNAAHDREDAAQLQLVSSTNNSSALVHVSTFSPLPTHAGRQSQGDLRNTSSATTLKKKSIVEDEQSLQKEECTDTLLDGEIGSNSSENKERDGDQNDMSISTTTLSSKRDGNDRTHSNIYTTTLSSKNSGNSNCGSTFTRHETSSNDGNSCTTHRSTSNCGESCTKHSSDSNGSSSCTNFWDTSTDGANNSSSTGCQELPDRSATWSYGLPPRNKGTDRQATDRQIQDTTSQHWKAADPQQQSDGSVVECRSVEGTSMGAEKQYSQSQKFLALHQQQRPETLKLQKQQRYEAEGKEPQQHLQNSFLEQDQRGHANELFYQQLADSSLQKQQLSGRRLRQEECCFQQVQKEHHVAAVANIHLALAPEDDRRGVPQAVAANTADTGWCRFSSFRLPSIDTPHEKHISYRDAAVVSSQLPLSAPSSSSSSRLSAAAGFRLVVTPTDSPWTDEAPAPPYCFDPLTYCSSCSSRRRCTLNNSSRSSSTKSSSSNASTSASSCGNNTSLHGYQGLSSEAPTSSESASGQPSQREQQVLQLLQLYAAYSSCAPDVFSSPMIALSQQIADPVPSCNNRNCCNSIYSAFQRRTDTQEGSGMSSTPLNRGLWKRIQTSRHITHGGQLPVPGRWNQLVTPPAATRVVVTPIPASLRATTSVEQERAGETCTTGVAAEDTVSREEFYEQQDEWGGCEAPVTYTITRELTRYYTVEDSGSDSKSPSDADFPP